GNRRAGRSQSSALGTFRILAQAGKRILLAASGAVVNRAGCRAARAGRKGAAHSVRSPMSAAAGRLNHEDIARSHLDLARRAELFARSVDALDPIAADCTRVSTRNAERRHTPVIREHHRGHRLEKTHASLRAVAAAMASGAAAAAPNRERL